MTSKFSPTNPKSTQLGFMLFEILTAAVLHNDLQIYAILFIYYTFVFSSSSKCRPQHIIKKKIH